MRWGAAGLPFKDEVTLACDGLDVLVELHHGDIFRKVPDEHGLLGALAALGSRGAAGRTSGVELEVALRAQRKLAKDALRGTPGGSRLLGSLDRVQQQLN